MQASPHLHAAVSCRRCSLGRWRCLHSSSSKDVMLLAAMRMGRARPTAVLDNPMTNIT
jgi:hypothetical protein